MTEDMVPEHTEEEWLAAIVEQTYKEWQCEQERLEQEQ